MMRKLLFPLVFIFCVLLVPSTALAASRISNFKATTDPAAANPNNYAKTLTFTYTAVAGDPALENFKVECGLTGGSTNWAKTIREFKCTYPKDPPTPYTVRLTPLDASGNPIGDPAELQVAENATPQTPPGTNPPPGSGNTPPGTATGTATGTPPAPAVTTYDGKNASLGHVTNPIGVNSVPAAIVKIINILLALIAMVAVVVIIISGFRYIVNSDNPAAVAKAKTAIIWAVAGLALALLAFAIVSIIQATLR